MGSDCTYRSGAGMRGVLFTVVMVGYCAAYANEPETKTVTLADLKIAIPASWEVVKEDTTLLTIRSPLDDPGDTFSENMRLKMYEMPQSRTVDQVLDAQLRTVGDKFETTGSGVLRESGPRIVWMSIKPNSPANEQEDLTKIDFMLVNGKKGYVVHCMMRTDKIDKYRKQFEEMAQSVVLTNPVVPKEKTPNEKAAEQGREFGQVWFYVMVFAVVIFGVVSIFRRIFSSRSNITH